LNALLRLRSSHRCHHLCACGLFASDIRSGHATPTCDTRSGTTPYTAAACHAFSRSPTSPPQYRRRHCRFCLSPRACYSGTTPSLSTRFINRSRVRRNAHAARPRLPPIQTAEKRCVDISRFLRRGPTALLYPAEQRRRWHEGVTCDASSYAPVPGTLRAVARLVQATSVRHALISRGAPYLIQCLTAPALL